MPLGALCERAIQLYTGYSRTRVGFLDATQDGKLKSISHRAQSPLIQLHPLLKTHIRYLNRLILVRLSLPNPFQNRSLVLRTDYLDLE